MIIAWLILFAILIIIELITVALTTIWFALGALAACLAAALGANYVIQVVVFTVVSLILMLVFRPLSVKFLKVGKEKTNTDVLVGKTARVTQEINNFTQTGTVYVRGLSWTARSSNDEIIPEGSKVVIEKISGVKLLVKMEIEKEED